MKILHVTTISSTVNAFLVPHIQKLYEDGNHVDIACNVTSPVNSQLTSMGCNVFDIPFQRTPFSKQNLSAGRELKKIIIEQKYDIVHFHTPVASAFGRFYAKGQRKNGLKVFYTAHGLHFYNGAPKLNWLIYYPVEKYLSKKTDVIITINSEDYNRAKSKFHSAQVFHINGIGFDVKKFENIEIDRSEKRRELGMSDNDFLMISVGELDKRKNQKIAIKAISKLNEKNVKYIICGNGTEEGSLCDMIDALSLGERVSLLGFRTDIGELYKASDLCLMPSSREGLGIAILEAMVVGVPVIASNTSGPRDLIADHKGGLTVDPHDPGKWAESIQYIMDNPDIADGFVEYSKKRALDYDIKISLNQMKEIYEKYT